MSTTTTRVTYYVLSAVKGWDVKLDEKRWNYASQALAINAAVAAAKATWSRGTPAQVLVQGQDGKWRTEWTYGQDPFPPRG